MELSEQYKRIANTGVFDDDFVKVGGGGDYVETSLRRTYLNIIGGSIPINTENIIGWTNGSINELGITIASNTQEIYVSEDGDYLVQSTTFSTGAVHNATAFIRVNSDDSQAFCKCSVNTQTTGKSIATGVLSLKAGDKFIVCYRTDVVTTINTRPDTLRIYKLADKTPRYIVDNFLPVTADGGPDWSQMENTNRLPSSTLSWTCDRDGYILAGGAASSSSVNGIIYINGKIVFYTVPEISTDYNWFKVSKDDVISKNALSNWYNSGGVCYFIPPKKAIILIRGDNPVIEPGYDYSPEEKPVLIYDSDTKTTRQKKFVTGELIYEKTIPWTSTALASGAALNIATVPNIKCVIESTAHAQIGVAGAMYIGVDGSSIVLRNDQESTLTAGLSWYITIQYIKN